MGYKLVATQYIFSNKLIKSQPKQNPRLLQISTSSARICSYSNKTHKHIISLLSRPSCCVCSYIFQPTSCQLVTWAIILFFDAIKIKNLSTVNDEIINLMAAVVLSMSSRRKTQQSGLTADLTVALIDINTCPFVSEMLECLLWEHGLPLAPCHFLWCVIINNGHGTLLTKLKQ